MSRLASSSGRAPWCWYSFTGTPFGGQWPGRPFPASSTPGRWSSKRAATSLNGPWTVSNTPPPGSYEAAQTMAKANAVDLMKGPANDSTGQRPTLASGAPGVVVETRPTEIVIPEGPMNWVPLEGTQLLYVGNTNGNVFQDLLDQQFYVLVTGRWFRAPNLAGPWAYVPGTALPADFSL